jgi:HD-GYP domain-containing protein (c-di-GMP phosphodiesterase class II)
LNSQPYVQSLHEATEAFHNLAGVDEYLAGLQDRRRVLELILREARRLTHAEAGSLYVLTHGRLHFVAAQNDRVGAEDIERMLLSRHLPASSDSLAGYVAAVGKVMNIADADAVADDAPFRIHRALEAETGYRVRSVLAVPLRCGDGELVGVLELFNRLDPRGRAVPFPAGEVVAALSLAAMAALAVHNMLLQERLKQAHLDTVIRLSVAVEFRDNATAEHIRRIAAAVACLARGVGLDPREVELYECASPMHDIGKIGIPDAILQKPGRLTPEERRVVEQHPGIGAEILGEPTNELLAAAREVALSHHERWDGRGYPARLAGRAIPLSGRIVGLADVWDALLSVRPYKAAMPLEQVVDVVREERERHFDPAVTDAAMNAIDALAALYAPRRAQPAGSLN